MDGTGARSRKRLSRRKVCLNLAHLLHVLAIAVLRLRAALQQNGRPAGQLLGAHGRHGRATRDIHLESEPPAAAWALPWYLGQVQRSPSRGLSSHPIGLVWT